MAKKHMKRCSVSLAVRELQNKIPARNQSKSSRNWCIRPPEYMHGHVHSSSVLKSQILEMTINDRIDKSLWNIELFYHTKRMSWGKDE